MKAIGYTASLPIEETDSLSDIELPIPGASGNDLLVKISAIAVNPVDYKIRQSKPADDGSHRIIGWDAVGTVTETGEAVTRFKPGDTVYYAGSLLRSGCNAEYQLVDEKLVGHKPTTLPDADAAALPLTGITAWELLFEHLNLAQSSPDDTKRSDEVLLVVGAAGGVGSILIQLARVLTGATIIATASREESRSWVTALGAHHVINHRLPLNAQLEDLGVGPLTHVASLNGTASYFDAYTEALQPFGKIAIIDDPGSVDISQLKPKSLSFHWEFMFARSMFNSPDMIQQGELLNRIANLVDAGLIRTTAGQHLGVINATNLKNAHQQLEAGRSIGKIVLEGFEPTT